MQGRKKQNKRKRAPKEPLSNLDGKRKRLAPELRRTHILDAAAQLIVRQGFLPLPTEQLARAAGTSKALVYTYFPTQYDIFNSLLQRELTALKIAGLDTASNVKDLDQAVLLCAMLYFEHVAQSGPLLHILVTDLYMAGHIDPAIARAGGVMLAKLTDTASAALALSKQEIQAAIEMLLVVPQNSGSLVFYKELAPAVARQLCHTLVLSSLVSLRSMNEPAA
jgi:AcrR family transcriptional regulator